MDRLSLFKALADGSRYAIYQQVAAAGEPLSTVQIAERLDLHPNTVRLHLEKMRDVGILEVQPDRHGSVGRPQHLWSVAADAPSMGLEPAGFRILAHLLAEVAADPGEASGRAVVVGRRRGRVRASRRAAERHVALSPDAGGVCFRALVDELTDLGFDPEVDEPFRPPVSPAEESTAGIFFARCPFRELAALYPDLVCELHRGLTEGILDGFAEDDGSRVVRLESFSGLVDADPCRIAVSIKP